MDPSIGNVSFGAGLHGWGFNLRQFARFYSSKFGVKEDKMMVKLWGNNFYDPATKQWSKVQSESSVRGFNRFVLDPLIMVNILLFLSLFLFNFLQSNVFFKNLGQIEEIVS